MVMEPDIWRGLWKGEDSIEDYFPWGRGYLFVWDRVYSMQVLGVLSEVLVLGAALF